MQAAALTVSLQCAGARTNEQTNGNIRRAGDFDRFQQYDNGICFFWKRRSTTRTRLFSVPTKTVVWVAVKAIGIVQDRKEWTRRALQLKIDLTHRLCCVQRLAETIQ